MQVAEHLGWVTAAQNLPVVFVRLLFLRLDAGIEFDFVDKFFVFRGLFSREAHLNIHQLGTVLEHIDQRGLALCCPVFLVVLSLLEAELLEGFVRLQQLRECFQAVIGQHTDMEFLDILV